jgi:FtsH-binding integral membrane protein
MTPVMTKIFGVMICLFALIRLVSHPAAQNRSIDYVLMAVMFACGIFLFFTKKSESSDTK